MLAAFSISADRFRAGEYRVCGCCGVQLRRGYMAGGIPIGKKCAESKGIVGRFQRGRFYSDCDERRIRSEMQTAINEFVNSARFVGA